LELIVRQFSDIRNFSFDHIFRRRRFLPDPAETLTSIVQVHPDRYYRNLRCPAPRAKSISRLLTV
jgi:hypothetical protein